ncbi:MAG: aldo/keto reductase family oxidoreductase [Succinivibrionaceae bacterium]
MNNKKSKIILGQMRINNKSQNEVNYLLDVSIELGINYFDHADIYGNGQCEKMFGNWFNTAKSNVKREDIVIQDKAGIVPGIAYNNSYDYLIKAVDNSLKNLRCDYLDNFLIHRPDVLMEPEEINKAFNELKEKGKVKNFGVSNFNSMQIDYLSSIVEQPIVINQLQLSVASAPMISENLETNTYSNDAVSRTLGVLDYCRKNRIQIQAWSPLQYGFFAGNFIDSPSYKSLNEVLENLALKYQVSKTSIAIAWINRLDKLVSVVVGTANPEHLKDIYTSTKVFLTREEFYKLYMAAGYRLP